MGPLLGPAAEGLRSLTASGKMRGGFCGEGPIPVTSRSHEGTTNGTAHISRIEEREEERRKADSGGGEARDHDCLLPLD